MNIQYYLDKKIAISNYQCQINKRTTINHSGNSTIIHYYRRHYYRRHCYRRHCYRRRCYRHHLNLQVVDIFDWMNCC